MASHSHQRSGQPEGEAPISVRRVPTRKFVVQKSQHLFSKISLNHHHEQENEMIKWDGGAVGLRESPTGLRRWMIAGPEIARAVRQLESTYDVRTEA